MEQSISSDFIRGHIDTIILHSILDSDKFAQQISDAIELKSQNKYQINQATLYSSLKRLESLGYVKSYWNDAPDGRRKYIKITDSGKAFLEENTSVWSYSKGIIDKLIDIQPEQVVKYVETTKYIEKPVTAVSPILNDASVKSEVKTSNETPVNNVTVSENKEKTFDMQDSASDISFRSILGELIKNNNPTEKPEENTEKELKPIESTEKLKLEETIDDVDYIAQNNINFNKIDFTDIVENAKKDDLKVKVSSKNSSVKVGNVYVNLLNLVSSLIIFLVTIAEFWFIASKYSDDLGLGTFMTVFSVLLLCVFPIVNFVFFKKKPKKTTVKIFGDTILVSFIVAFNVILISFAMNLLFNVDFSATGTIILSLIIPVLLSVDAVLYYVIRFFLARLKKFRYTV